MGAAVLHYQPEPAGRLALGLPLPLSPGHPAGHPTEHPTKHSTGYSTEHPTGYPTGHPAGHPTGYPAADEGWGGRGDKKVSLRPQDCVPGESSGWGVAMVIVYRDAHEFCSTVTVGNRTRARAS